MISVDGKGVWLHWDRTATGALRCDGAGVHGPNARAKRPNWMAWEPRRRETLVDGEGNPIEFADLADAMTELDRTYPVGSCGSVRRCDNGFDVPGARDAIIAAVRDMRRLQRAFFAGDFSQLGRTELIRSAKSAERRVDKLLEELDGPGPAQGEMFKP